MSNEFNEFVAQVLKVKANINSDIKADTVLTLVFEGESWVSYFASKSPSEETYATSTQIALLENLKDSCESNITSIACILLKAKYDLQSDTRPIRVINRRLLESLSDSELLHLKDNVRSAQKRLNKYDSITAMKVLNKNRILIDDILLTRPDPKTKLNALLE